MPNDLAKKTLASQKSTSGFHLHNSFAFWLTRLSHSLNESLNQMLKQHDLTFSQWQVLNVLHHLPINTPAQIAHEIGLDRSAVTRLVDKLCVNGYVTREHDKLDRRSVIVMLSESGNDVVSTTNALVYDHQQLFLTHLHRSERRGLKGEVQKILRTFDIDTLDLWQRAD